MMPELKLPQEMKDFQILNPDSPLIDSYITVKKEGVSIDCAMYPYAEEDYHGGFRLSYKKRGFIRLNDKKEITYDKDGKPVIYSVDEVTGFYEQVGENTSYIDQPEEILAVNFQLML
jgi:hypothetical protein